MRKSQLTHHAKIQTLKTSFAAAGFKTEVKSLSDFKEDYGLAAAMEEGEDPVDDDDDDEEGSEGSEEGSEDGNA